VDPIHVTPFTVSDYLFRGGAGGGDLGAGIFPLTRPPSSS